MNPSSKVPLIWAYLTFVAAGFLFFEADEDLMPSFLSITFGVLSSMMCLYSLNRSKPYIYQCEFWKSFFLISIPLVLFIYFNKNNQEFLANFLGSIMVFNLITFFFYRMIADFTDIENLVKVDSQTSKLFSGSKNDQKEVMRSESIGQTARFVADAFYNWGKSYNLEANKVENQTSILKDVETVSYHAIEIRFANEKDHIHKKQIIIEYLRSPNSGLIDLVISILKIEAELHLNERAYIESFIEVMFEELKAKHISDEMIFGNIGLNLSNTKKALTEFGILEPQ